MRKCPNCGSKNLDVEDSASGDFQIVCCLDCDAVFELHQKASKRSRFASDEDEEDLDHDDWTNDSDSDLDFEDDDDR